MKTIGTVTIGQSPRTDLVPEMETLLKRDVDSNLEIIEKGALDDLSRKEMADLAPRNDQETLVSRTREGKEVSIAKEKVLPLVQEKIDELNDERVDVIILLCSGEFPPMKSTAPLMYPYKLLTSSLETLSGLEKLGVIVPTEEQVEGIGRAFRSLGTGQVTVAVSSPYKYELATLREASKELKRADVGLVVLDCFGYTLEMERIVEDVIDKPTITVRSLTAHFAAELIS